MRIRIKYYGTDCGSSCETTTFGEVEDYSLNVNSNFVDWLALDPIAGTISGQGTTNINLTFNSTGMDEGDYYADVTINCNDPNQPQIIIPVQLIVTGAGFVDLKVFLEGPFSGIEMTNDLNVAGYLPLDQPYNIEPWNYTGTESVQAIPNSDIVDWILIEYRDATDAISAIGSTSIGRQAAFLIKDGSVVDLDGTSILQFNPEGSGVIHQLFTVVWYRNHLGIMSANPVTESGGIYTYDFTISSGQAYGSLPQKEIVPGIWGLYSGDGNCDGYINDSDKSNIWESQAGTAGYFTGDFNMDCNIDNIDKNDVWKPNEGMGSQVPD